MHFIRLTEHDVDDVMKFILADIEAAEPLMKSLALERDDARLFFEDLLIEAVNSGVSFIVRTDDHEIVAARLSTFRTREEAFRDARHIPYHNLTTRLERAKSVLWHLNQQFWNEASPDINKVYYLMAVVVDPHYRYTDMVDKLVHYNMDELRTVDAHGLLANAAIFHNEMLLHRLGYRVVAETNSSPNTSGQLHRHDDGVKKAQLVFKEMWRDENLETHIVI